jgi:sugar/nucleoside kinase (ribokinase family)
MKFDIVTFGSAAQDVHIKSKAFKILQDEKDFATGQGICLPFGSKIDVEAIEFASGGGGTNTAATFAKQGLKVAYCGAIGVDVAGLEIVRELKHLRVDTRFVVKKKEKHTNHSIIISSASADRTIMIYRGASDLLCDKDIKWHKIKKTKWFYLAPLTDTACDVFGSLISFAKGNNIKVACNPSKQQLTLPVDELRKIFSKIDVLFLNQEEASLLTKVDYKDEIEIFKKLDELCPRVVIMTKGGEGVIVSDGKYLYSAPGSGKIETKIVDTTGAGDSFASGFLSDYIRTNGDIEKAIQLGLANSLANLTKVGAKSGILEKNAKFERIPVTKQLCAENNLCINK